MGLIDSDILIKEINNMSDDCLLFRWRSAKKIKSGLTRIISKQPIYYDIDKVVEELEKQAENTVLDFMSGGYVAIDKAIEIVKQGGVSDDVCEWKLEDEEANLYLTGCQQRQLIFEGTPKENGCRYCPYCGKKIKVVE